ncbi:hypothetical protein ACQP2P_37930 [Dactylosporangium sp. CA-139114]|uniref:hypothetical protein n=1 Tax=Dactylosporangium sp. CA-139114 TaxID=3239931 RepID=UPI003D99828F
MWPVLLRVLRGDQRFPAAAPRRADAWPGTWWRASAARASVGGTRFAAGGETRTVLHRAGAAMSPAKRGAAAVAGQALR